jgi:cell division ATPase FtsA
MNKKEQYVAAIDIGTTKIVAIVGKKNGNGKLKFSDLARLLPKV